MASAVKMPGITSRLAAAEPEGQRTEQMSMLHLCSSMQAYKCQGAHRHLQDDVDGVAYPGV